MSSKERKARDACHRRIDRIKALGDIDTRDINVNPPAGSVKADQQALAHNNTYDGLPVFYVDRVFSCRDCGKEEIWTAEQQKWWYEVAKGNLNATAVRCRKCRTIKKQRQKGKQT